MKKLLLILTFCMALNSCSTMKDIEISEIEPSEISAEEMSSTEGDIKSEFLQLNNCYKKEKITLPDDMVSISQAFSFSNNSVIVVGTNKDYSKNMIYRTDKSFNQFTSFSYSLPEEVQDYDVVHDNVSFNFDGSFNVVIAMEDHGGMIAPDEYDESFDYESYNANCVTSYMICSYDSGGNILNKSQINYPDELFSDDDYLISGNILSDGDSVLQSFGDGSIRRISSEGEFTTVYEIENPDDYVYTSPANLYRDRDGKIICMMHENKEVFDSEGRSYGENMLNFYEFIENGISGESLYTCNEYDLASDPVFGRDDYRFFIPTHDGLIGITDDGKKDTVIDWVNSGLEAMWVVPTDEDNFIGMEWNNSDEDSAVKLTPRDMSEFANTKMITVANCFDTKIINDFNNSQTDYRIRISDYSSDDNSQLNLDIISGNAPDIICNLEYSDYLNYCNKGLFTDLYQFMNNDSELNIDAVMPNVVTALESADGKLNALCTSFDVSTMVSKTKFCNKENWTFDDMINLYDNAPESMIHLYDGISKSDMFHTMFYSMNELIDYDNATCDFNNQRFLQMLEFCNRFVDNVDMPDKMTDYEAFSNYYEDKYRWFANDQILVETLNFYDLSSYNLVKYIQGGGEDLTIVGYPSDNGKGGRITPQSLISINEKCENKQGAWEFLKFCVLKSNEIKDNEGEYSNISGIPVLTASFDKAMDVEMQSKHSANGEKYPSYTKEESNMISSYIKSCNSIGTVLDNDVVVICDEEAGLYFADEQSAEDTVEHIQNRVSVLISERN